MCLDKDPGSTSLVLQHRDGWVTVGGLFGGRDNPFGTIERKEILLKNRVPLRGY